MNSPAVFCKTCRKPKAPYTCGLCQEHVCKSCAEFLDQDAFAFLKKIPEELTHTAYCSNCFDDKVAAPLADYNQALEKARDIYIFTKDQTKQTRLLKRKEEPYHVENCEDEEEAIMRMSFMAVQAHFNAVIDIQLNSKKIIVGSHKKTIWSGTGVPITIDPNAVGEY